MRTRLKRWTWRRAIPGVHPRMEELLSWADGNLSGPLRSALEAHLTRCNRCCEDARSIRAAADSRERAWNQRAHQVRLLEEGFDDLEAGMCLWSSLRGLVPLGPRRGLLGSAINQRLTRAVSLYFGQEAASRVAVSPHPGSPERPLLTAIKPLFNAFLGRKAADSLVRHIDHTT